MDLEGVVTHRIDRSVVVSRRAALRLAAGAAVGVALLPRWTSADDEEVAAFTGDTFVGEIQDPAAFVAVVVSAARPGAASREARALIYGDPDNGINEWFNAGSVGGGELDLRGEMGGALTAGIAADGVAGTIRLADGRSLDVTALPVDGTAGIYTLTAAPDGRLSGTSAEGAKLEGMIAPEPLSDLTEGTGRHLAVGLLTPPAGQARVFAITVTAFPAESIPARFIVAADGRIRGGIDTHPLPHAFKVDASIGFEP